MPRRRPLRPPRLPGMRGLAWLAFGMLLTGGFVLRGFPYERLAAALSAAVARSGPFALQLQQLGPHLSPLGPGVQASGLRLVARNGAGLHIDELVLRPAWSLRWLLLRPTFQVAARLGEGRVDGTLGSGPSFAGELTSIDLAQLPLAPLWPGAELRGLLGGSVDLRAGAQGPEGTLVLEAHDGSATLPGVPLPLPFATLTARLGLGGDVRLRVEALELSGPGLVARASGTLGPAASFAQAACDLAVEVEAEPALAPALRRAGLRLGRDGRGSLRITGTPLRPRVE